MIQKEEFLGKYYETFKKEARAIIHKLETGGYTMEIDEENDPLEHMFHIQDKDRPHSQDQCSFFQFFSEIYRLPYVKNIIRYAEQQGFSLYGPEETKEQYSMEQFVQKVLPKKGSTAHMETSCFDLVFVKKTAGEKVRPSDIYKVTLLDQQESKFQVRAEQDLFKEITRLTIQ